MKKMSPKIDNNENHQGNGLRIMLSIDPENLAMGIAQCKSVTIKVNVNKDRQSESRQ